jgi:hypothetical protein
MSSVVGLDRTRLLKPLIVLAGWTFVQEVSSFEQISESILPAYSYYIGMDVRDSFACH